MCCFRRAEPVLIALLVAGVPVNAQTKTTKATALHCVVHQGNKNNDTAKARMAALVIYYGADVTITDNRNRTALQWAKRRKLVKTAAVMERLHDIRSGTVWSPATHKYCTLTLKRKIKLFLMITSFCRDESGGSSDGNRDGSRGGSRSGGDGRNRDPQQLPSFINTTFTSKATYDKWIVEQRLNELHVKSADATDSYSGLSNPARGQASVLAWLRKRDVRNRTNAVSSNIAGSGGSGVDDASGSRVACASQFRLPPELQRHILLFVRSARWGDGHALVNSEQFASWTSPPPAPPIAADAPPPPPAVETPESLAQLAAMGFLHEALNLQALEAANGDVGAALTFLMGDR